MEGCKPARFSKVFLVSTFMQCTKTRTKSVQFQTFLSFLVSNRHLIILFFGVFSGKAPLQCYMCNNDISFEECTYYQSNGTCKPNEDRCMKAMWDIGTIGSISTGYIKGCTTKDLCKKEAHKICNSTDGYAMCEVYCCEGNLCNSAGSNLPSILVVSILVLLSVRFHFE